MSTIADVKKVSHLTVTTFTDGKMALEWDWVALENEVKLATNLANVQIPDLNVMNKIEIEQFAKSVGLVVDKRKKKEVMIKAITDYLDTFK